MDTFAVATQEHGAGTPAPDGTLALHEELKLRRMEAVVDECVCAPAGHQVNLFARIETPLAAIDLRGKLKAGNELAVECAFGHRPAHNVIAVGGLVLDDDIFVLQVCSALDGVYLHDLDLSHCAHSPFNNSLRFA